MIVESWLSEEVDSSIRGQVFGTYAMINLIGSTGGQMILIGADISGHWYFMLAAIFYCLALIPTAISSNRAPAPLFEVKLNIPRLWRNSPVAVFAALMIGISNGTFGTLAAVYGNRIGLDMTSIVLFCSIPVLAGALFQLPVGKASDRFDRRKILVLLSVLAILAESIFLTVSPQTGIENILIGSLLGAAMFAMYPIVLAHANDHAELGQSLQISGGLLMFFGYGSILGPFFGGIALSMIGPPALFWTMISSHILIVLFTIWRMSRREPAKSEEKPAFKAYPLARTSTPATEALSDRHKR